MKNKKSQSTTTVIIIFIIILLAFFIFGYFMYKQVIGYLTYSKFCKNHTDMCYCDIFNGCSFRLSHSSSTSSYTINGMQIQVNSSNSDSDNMKEFCDLARKIKDKEMLFDAEC